MKKKMIKFIAILFLPMCFFEAKGQEIKHHIYFDFNKYNLNRTSLYSLDSLYLKIQDLKDYTIEIYGHTDNIASEKYNLLLSQQRAHTVEAFFLKKNIDKKKIFIKSFGENKPVVSNTEPENRQKNRRVEITVKFHSNNINTTAATDTLPEIKPDIIFEKDTVIYCRQGAIIEIDAGTFYPYKIKDIDFNIKEYYSRCDLINSNITMQTDSGDCLTSGGMIFLRPMLDTVELQPNKGKKVRIRIPANNNIIDNEMCIYVANKRDDHIVWSKKNIKLKHDQESGMFYYAFDLDTMLGINIDKTIQARCEENGPLVKINGFIDAKVYLTYPKEMYLSKGIQLSKRKYSLVKIAENKKPTLTITTEKNGITYTASGPLLELKYNKSKNMYVVRKKYFKPVNIKNNSTLRSIEDIICESAALRD